MKLLSIAGKHVAIRSTPKGMVVRPLDGGAEMCMEEEAWFELVGLIVAIKAAVDFDAAYSAE